MQLLFFEKNLRIRKSVFLQEFLDEVEKRNTLFSFRSMNGIFHIQFLIVLKINRRTLVTSVMS